ncbi:MAG: phosphoethanolamine transferase [Acidaminococcus sp.]|jgi:heptose-I-phosphate ethanolaminephosphotransferase|nr:phosphoethanolamine transferase [Acidaminococcus sp.]MCI2101075.1 phosphoethanolamine transferase [Acidaminococcus sp.]MCI2115474.1 phosphoethanolamine transferase [Acidaminococcus sp.]MCI2117602.1 phosphoethanolamine transferase [Acidaminococcus sp.]
MSHLIRSILISILTFLISAGICFGVPYCFAEPNYWQDKYALIPAALFALMVYFKEKKSTCLIHAYWNGLIYILPLALLFWQPNAKVTYLEGHSALVTSLMASMALTLLLTFCKSTAKKWLHRTLTVLTVIIALILELFPLGAIFYAVLSHGRPLLAEIVLTLFQTNLNESWSYIKTQPAENWIMATAALLLFGGIEAYLLNKLHKEAQPISSRPLAIAFIALFAASAGFTIYYGKDYPVGITLKETVESLGEYYEYAQAKTERMERLENLKSLTIAQEAKGLHVLVIGESATKDHMHTYGYKRPTTPWLDEFSKEPGTLLFNHAYSNHVHTVQSLTYALSEKNQYNDIEQEDANSIIEIAKAAGYDTWWISNQRLFGVWDTPTSEIASTADHQIWLNGHAGTGVSTDHYDGIILQHLPKLTTAQPTLIVIHLMGSHNDYEDRYPKANAPFEVENYHTDTYDNSIAYTDYVLKGIYKWCVKQPHFASFIYMPDHAEDIDHFEGHEITRFTFDMTHIPLVIHLSKETRDNRPGLYLTLAEHIDSYWTNDLLYNLMLDTLGIENAPVVEEKLDIASPEYSLRKDELWLLHNRRRLEE